MLMCTLALIHGTVAQCPNNLFANGSLIGVAGANTTAAPWVQTPCPMGTVDLNTDVGVLQSTPPITAWATPPVASGDGNTWQNVCCGNECISQTVGLVPGTMYTLSFEYTSHDVSAPGGGPFGGPDGVSVLMNGILLFDTPLDLTPNTWEFASFTFAPVLAANDFQFQGITNQYVGIDGICLVEAVTTPPPPPTLLGPDTMICDNDSIVFDVSGIGSSVSWNTGSTDSIFVVNVTGQYEVSIVTPQGNVGDTVFVTVNPAPVFDLGNDTAICAIDTLVLSAFSPGATYLWSDASMADTLQLVAPGDYWAVASLGPCSVIDAFRLEHIPIPVVDFGPDTVICSEANLPLSVGTEPWPSVVWSTGDSVNNIVVDEPGEYDVVIGNICGTATDEIIVETELCVCFLLPNAFSPNGDGINDTFSATSECSLEGLEFFVFNRWGEVLYQSFDLNAFWDGTYNGKLVEPGVYPYSARFRVDGDAERVMGSVTVVR